jgi:hypothetical protein
MKWSDRILYMYVHRISYGLCWLLFAETNSCFVFLLCSHNRGPMAFQKFMSALDKADYVYLVKDVNRVLYDV